MNDERTSTTEAEGTPRVTATIDGVEVTVA